MASRKNLVVLFAVGMLLVSGLACGGSSDDLTVDAVVEHQTEVVEEGVKCEYTFISTDVQVRLAHYRICKDSNSEKRLEALEKALQDCFELCGENEDCVKQCKGE